jgi:hypothetical protein
MRAVLPIMPRVRLALVLSCLPWLVSAGCGGKLAPSDAGACGASCVPCPGTEACVGARQSADYHPTCLAVCQTTSDCPSGMRCAALSGELGGPVCVSASTPVACAPGGAWSCTLADPSCDGATLQKPFTETANHTCGYERLACPSGCDPGGGSVLAHCK